MENMEDKTILVTMRVIDLANPSPGAWTKPCDDCSELTWISSVWKDKKIDKVVCKPCWLKKCEPPSDKSDGFLLQRIPTGFSTGLKSCSSCNTMSRSLLSSALRKTEIERLMCTLRPVFLVGQQSIYGLKLFNAMPIPESRSTLFYGIGITIARGMIHPPDKSGGILYPLTPRYKDENYVACTNEETIQQVLKVLRGRGINVTREEILKNFGIKIGRELHVI